MNNPLRITKQEPLLETGEIIFLHNKKGSSSPAYEIHEAARVVIKIPTSLSTVSARLKIENMTSKKSIPSIKFEWIGCQLGYDSYQAKLPISALGIGIYFFSIEFDTIFGEIFAKKANGILYFSKEAPQGLFQFSVSDFKYKAPHEQYGGIIYHVFVDRFNCVKNRIAKDGAYLINDWYSPIPEYPSYPGAPVKNNYFYGGDLYGIADKLDYLKSLGTTILYLSPIFESPSNHKYDTSDYMKVDAAFGGDKALEYLISKAGKMGISVILDGVFNHTGDNSIYFNRYGKYSSQGAYQSKESEYFPWYSFKSHPNEYSAWWGIEILPKINPDLPECRNFFVGNDGVIEKYAKLGILGLRLDVADELSDDFISAIKEKLNKHNSASFLYGEVWEDASNKIAYGKLKNYYLGSELDGVMNYPLRQGLVNFLKNENDEKLRYALTEVTFNAPKRIRDAQMNILGTHDTERIITVLGGEDSSGKSNEYLSAAKMNKSEYEKGRRRLLEAVTALYTLPGIPCVFYGDEAGLEGYNDPFNRRTFPWNNIDSVIVAHYRKMAKIRMDNNVYKCGDFRLLHLGGGILIFERTNRSSSFITILNNSQKDVTIKFSNKVISLFDAKKADSFTIKSENSTVIKAKKNIHFEI